MLRHAIRLRPDYPEAHYTLGNALNDRGDKAGAIAAYRTAIRLRSDHAEAHCNLGHALRDTGHYAEALAALRRGHELGLRAGDRWKYPSGQWVKECERLAALEEKLTAVLAGEKAPADADEAVALVNMCLVKRLHAGAVRCYREAFRLNPAWVGRNVHGHRYDAARVAARAGCGDGADVAPLSSGERARLRQQARTWLNQELDLWSRTIARSDVRAALPAALGNWRICPELKGVRDEAELAKLSEAEQADWRRLWARVAELQARVRGREVAPPPRPVH